MLYLIDMGRVTLEGYVCERCGHTWVPRSKIDELPTICPKCKSPYWNKMRMKDRVKEPKVKEQKLRGDKF
jgi:DNA-directed RNA polymerase subunit RPC12/RpoP